VQYQNQLRENIHEKQLQEYVDIGKEKLQELFIKWENQVNQVSYFLFQGLYFINSLKKIAWKS
jgi:hypothetical protein